MHTIDPHSLHQKLSEHTLLLIDVREPAEHRSAHIKGDTLIPLNQISSYSLPKTHQFVAVYCQMGQRSEEAVFHLHKKHPSHTIVSLQGGINAWRQAKLPLEQSSSYCLPLDRQTQLAAGSLAFSGTLMGYFINTTLFIIPGFIGLGLMFAGLSGWCGMAKLLAKMPWNR